MSNLQRSIQHVVCYLVIATAVAGTQVQAQVEDCTGPGTGSQPFEFLQSGFTQELYASDPLIYPAIAFAPNGDVWWGIGPNIYFPGNPSLLALYSATSTELMNGSAVHISVAGPFATNLGSDLTNGFNGNLYSNTVDGVVMLDPTTGALIAGPSGPLGNGLGIATDPQTGNLVYVGANDTLFFIDPTLTSSGVFSTATAGADLDGIYFDPTGNFLFVAGSVPTTVAGLGVLDRQGNLLQVIPNPGGGVLGSFCDGPDGVAFHEDPDFVVSANRDGSLTRYDFPYGFGQPPIVSDFATGGFRGDFTKVGPEGCLFVTQLGTRFNDETVSLDASLVRICPGFVAPPGVNPAPGKVTGGGSVFTNDGIRVTHGFYLHCNPSDRPNRLQIDWGPGIRFQLDTLTAAVCFEDTSILGTKAAARFNTIIGSGSGTYDKIPGASISFTFTDAGEPGVNDSADIVITDATGQVVLSVSGRLMKGNQQAHAR